MRDDRHSAVMPATPVEGAVRKDSGIYRFVIVTLDAHAAGPAARVAPRLARDFPGIEVSVHAAAEWAENPSALARARAAVAEANIVVANLLFIEEPAVPGNIEVFKRLKDKIAMRSDFIPFTGNR